MKRGSRKKTRLRTQLVLLGASCMLSLLVAEVALRALGLPVTYEPRASTGEEDLHGGLPDGTMIYRANRVFTHRYDPAGDTRGYFGSDGVITYQINEHGLRGPSIGVDKPASTTRVLCLGDSITFGEGVRYEDTYSARLETLLSEAYPEQTFQVINGGVQAYGTRHALALYEQLGHQFKPDVVVLGFFLNDATDFFTTIDQFQAITTEPSDGQGFLHLSRLIGQAWYARSVQNAYFQTTKESFESDEWRVCREAFARFQELGKRDGFRFVVVLFPMLWQLDDTYPFADIHAEIAAACDDADCELIDLFDVVRGQPAKSLWAHPTDQHPNEIVHRRVAERLAEYLNPHLGSPIPVKVAPPF